MALTWTCPTCGKLYFSENEARGCTHGQATKRCPKCLGGGVIAGGIFGPNTTCTVCNGTGKVKLF